MKQRTRLCTILNFFRRCQVLLGSRLLPKLRRGGQARHGVLRRLHLLLRLGEDRQRKLLLLCAELSLQPGKIHRKPRVCEMHIFVFSYPMFDHSCYF